MEPAIRAAREKIGVPTWCMANMLKITEEDYLYCEEHFNDSNAFICLRICNILGLDFSKV